MTTETFDDIDTPVDEAMLMGSDSDDNGNDDVDQEALRALAGEEDGEGEGDAEASGGDEAQAGGDAAAVEAAADAAADEAAQKNQRDTHIPRDRFDEVNARRREAEERNRELEARLAALELAGKKEGGDAGRTPEADPTQPKLDIEAKEREYLEATYTGDTDAALAIRREIQAEERRMLEEQRKAIAAEAEARAIERIRNEEQSRAVKAIAKSAVEKYAFLDDNGGNNPAMDEILELRDFYVFRGKSPAEALQDAIDKVAPNYAAAAGAPPAAKPEPKADTRKADAVARNAEDASRQAPAPNAGIGNRVAPPEPTIETQDDWEKLPAAERERLLQGA